MIKTFDRFRCTSRGFGLMFQDFALFPHLSVGGQTSLTGLKRLGSKA